MYPEQNICSGAKHLHRTFRVRYPPPREAVVFRSKTFAPVQNICTGHSGFGICRHARHLYSRAKHLLRSIPFSRAAHPAGSRQTPHDSTIKPDLSQNDYELCNAIRRFVVRCSAAHRLLPSGGPLPPRKKCLDGVKSL